MYVVNKQIPLTSLYFYCYKYEVKLISACCVFVQPISYADFFVADVLTSMSKVSQQNLGTLGPVSLYALCQHRTRFNTMCRTF